MSSDRKRVILQIILFLLTITCTTLAGSSWTYSRAIGFTEYSWKDFLSGLEYSIPFLLILTVHELGHYFVARYHKVKVTLPYYIPFPPLPYSLGTLGAVIRLRSRVYSKKQNFDIGIAGPLAGFVMALIVLFYGYTNLPGPEYIFQIHPEYEQYGMDYADHVYKDLPAGADIWMGKNLVFLFFENYVADPERVPNAHEIMHYPYLFAGFLSLIFTSLNLFPIGQLDGGHVSYGLFGYRAHKLIATIAFFVMLLYAGIGVIDLTMSPDDLLLWIGGGLLFLYTSLYGLGLTPKDTLMYSLLILAFLIVAGWLFPAVQGYRWWLLFVFIVGRFIGIGHPPSEIEEPLDNKRIILGWVALIIFVISFSPAPINIK
jgi:membrane-associated protease RseP (regulator of RpoE activity)